MRWLKRPSFAVTLLLNHLPIWVFTWGMLILTPVALMYFSDQVDGLEMALINGSLEPAALHAAAALVKHAWLLCFGVFVVFGLGGSAAALWTHRAVSKRLSAIAAYARAKAAGEDIEDIVPAGDGIFGELERALVATVREIEARDQRLQEEARMQRIDAQLQRALDQSDSEEEAYQVAGRALGVLLGETSSELLVADASHAHLRRVASNPHAPPPGCSAESPSACAAVRCGKTLDFDSVDGLDACLKLRRDGVRGGVCSPVSVLGRTVGVIHAVRGDEADDADVGPEAVQALRLVSGHLGTRLGILSTLTTTRRQAERDALTGLLNRRSFRDAVAVQLAKGKTSSFVMCDLDHFKRLNDTAGHEAGDRALQLFARVVRSALRPADLVGRWGGEEFAVFLPSCEGPDALVVMDRLREKLQAALERSSAPPFTFSGGVAIAPEHGEDLDELASTADRALYDAKRAGRNRVLLAGGAPDSQPGAEDSVEESSHIAAAE